MDNEEPKSDSGHPAQNRERSKDHVLKPGENFGNFRVVKCLCAGLIANYYHMQHVRDLHDITVAVFHHRVKKDPKFLKRIELLQKTVQSLDHEAIPHIGDCTEIDERICLFMEPVKGQTLSQYFDAHGTPGQSGIGVDSAMRIVARLLGVLGYAHSQGLDHRDLDSDMIFLQEDGSIRLLGLGVKAALGNELFEAVVSASVSPLDPNKTAGRLNSFDVMSPEYKSGVQEDSRVDIYCVGVIAYWLLTGRKPDFAKLVPASQLIEGLPARWDEFFARALDRNQETRFQSCKSVLLSLKDTDNEPNSERAGLVQRQIDRIPVPKSIVARGDLASRIYRLSIIGFVGLTLTALMSFFISVTFTEDRDESMPAIQQVEAGESPQLKIRVSPPQARVEFEGHQESFMTSGGVLELSLLPGDYRVSVSAPQYQAVTQPVKIAADNASSVQELNFELEPTWTQIEIRSEPGASISLIDAREIEIELGVADQTGVFRLERGIFTGTYQLVGRKKGFASKILEEQDLAKLVQIDLALKPLPASLTVETNPAGARILVNQVEVGFSPVRLDAVAPGEPYLVVAELEDFRRIGRRFEARPGQDIVVDFGDLAPRSAELQLDAEFAGVGEQETRAMLEETLVVIGDQSIPYGSPELKIVPEGAYSVQLKHPQYESKRIDVVLKDRDVKKLRFVLRPIPGQVRLQIPEGLDPTIRLNGQVVQVEGGVVTVPTKVPVEFELRMRNYLTMVRDFHLDSGEQVVWNVSPVPIPGPSKGDAWTVPYLGFKFAWVPPGRFTMGSAMREQGRLPNEGPETEVSFTAGFWAGVFEVTQAEFSLLMNRNPAQFAGPEKPVDSVTWEDAEAFCRALTAFERSADRLPEGYVYRLPTEAEWEYAARAGTVTPFHFGDQADATSGNFRGVYPRDLEDGQRITDSYGTENVGGYSANAFGLYDVHGNVSEWTLDVYNGRLPGGALSDPMPRTGGKRFAVRGGSWEDFAVRVRSGVRQDVREDTESNAIGFRVFLAPEK
jgi:formylglycine-generating enzyme required for sulfatase activity/serine/threonine protein kinase